jgi:hypothetical protein
MDGLSRSSSARRRAGGLARAALVALIATVGLVAVPGTASAAGGDGSITPLLDCLRQNGDGTVTAILGYTNSARNAETIPVGTWNKISPTNYNGPQPTTFASGTKHGAYTVTMTRSEYSGGPSWFLDGKFAFFGSSWASGVPTCPSSTELPEDGNGTGPAIALAFAGVVGAVAVRRVRRRADVEAADSAGAGRDDA